jgi:hypothetical protein
MTENKKMTEKEILEMDFYDICGVSSMFMSNEDKIKDWNERERSLSKGSNSIDYSNL